MHFVRREGPQGGAPAAHVQPTSRPSSSRSQGTGALRPRRARWRAVASAQGIGETVRVPGCRLAHMNQREVSPCRSIAPPCASVPLPVPLHVSSWQRPPARSRPLRPEPLRLPLQRRHRRLPDPRSTAAPRARARCGSRRLRRPRSQRLPTSCRSQSSRRRPASRLRSSRLASPMPARSVSARRARSSLDRGSSTRSTPSARRTGSARSR
jgi:hypothetical protein